MNVRNEDAPTCPFLAHLDPSGAHRLHSRTLAAQWLAMALHTGYNHAFLTHESALKFSLLLVTEFISLLSN